MTEPLNTVALESFIQMVKSADASNQKEIRMDLKQAKNLSYTLGTMLARLNGNIESMMSAMQKNQTVTISMDPGNTW